MPYSRSQLEKPSVWYEQSYLARDESIRKEQAYWVENKGAGLAFSSTQLGQDVITSNTMILALQRYN